MIHWGWLILALLVGELLGVWATAICVASKDQEEKSKKMRRSASVAAPTDQERTDSE